MDNKDKEVVSKESLIE